jgi:hypothetical protein
LRRQVVAREGIQMSGVAVHFSISLSAGHGQ